MPSSIRPGSMPTTVLPQLLSRRGDYGCSWWATREMLNHIYVIQPPGQGVQL